MKGEMEGFPVPFGKVEEFPDHLAGTLTGGLPMPRDCKIEVKSEMVQVVEKV